MPGSQPIVDLIAEDPIEMPTEAEWLDAIDQIQMMQIGADYELGYHHGSSAAWKVFKERLDRHKAKHQEEVDLCIEHLDLLEQSFGGPPTKYVCSLCGAGPDEDHSLFCPLELSRQKLAAAAKR